LTRWLLVSIRARDCPLIRLIARVTGVPHHLKSEKKDCHLDNLVLSPKIEREADKLLAQIARADSMIVAAKSGARAEGFVLGL
jgi:hypothetical protein